MKSVSSEYPLEQDGILMSLWGGLKKLVGLLTFEDLGLSILSFFSAIIKIYFKIFSY